MPVTRNVRVEVAEAEGTLAEEEDAYALYYTRLIAKRGICGTTFYSLNRVLGGKN